MKNLTLAVCLATSLLLSACGGTEPAPVGEDYKIRSATPGVVDHNVIPKKSAK